MSFFTSSPLFSFFSHLPASHRSSNTQQMFRQKEELFSFNSSAEENLERYLDTVAKEFLQDEDKVKAAHLSPANLTKTFNKSMIPLEGENLENYFDNFVHDVVKESTHTSSRKLIGHMAMSLPFYHRALAKLLISMNQNVVKVETASTVTFLERETLAMLHRKFYNLEESFYENFMHDPKTSLGSICSGGTLANLTGLWCGRNKSLPPNRDFPGVEKTGIMRALKHYGYTDAVIIGSQLMHYSMAKAADILGIGLDGLVKIPMDHNCCIRLDLLEEKIKELQANNVLIIALVGVAGTTETGAFDDLNGMAKLAETYNIHFHVDAAWGGPLIFSEVHKNKLQGIEKADSITVDGHKQLYTPMGCGIIIFKDPYSAQAIRKTANYIIREDSFDTGKFTPEGSRPANVIYLHANLCLLGSSGLGQLIDKSCNLVAYMAQTLKSSPEFELLLEPMSNILLYRYIPPHLRSKQPNEFTKEENELINEVNRQLQAKQKIDGSSFVSRTTVYFPKYEMDIVGLRVVIANPRTEQEDIDFCLKEQLQIMEAFQN